jgi:hypothetical protein
MIRGTPTRVELKASDISEYEVAKAGWKLSSSVPKNVPTPMPTNTTNIDKQIQHSRIGLTMKTN